jgi:hypothetical protein
MSFAVVHSICLCQRILKLSDAGRQGTDLVMKHFGVRENETVCIAIVDVLAWKFSRRRREKKAHRFPLPVVSDPELTREHETRIHIVHSC